MKPDRPKYSPNGTRARNSPKFIAAGEESGLRMTLVLSAQPGQAFCYPDEKVVKPCRVCGPAHTPRDADARFAALSNLIGRIPSSNEIGHGATEPQSHRATEKGQIKIGMYSPLSSVSL